MQLSLLLLFLLPLLNAVLSKKRTWELLLLPHLNYFLPYWIGAAGIFLVHLLISNVGWPVIKTSPSYAMSYSNFKISCNSINIFILYGFKTFLLAVISLFWVDSIEENYYDILYYKGPVDRLNIAFRLNILKLFYGWQRWASDYIQIKPY